MRTRNSTTQGQLNRFQLAEVKPAWPSSVARAGDAELAKLEEERYAMIWARRAPEDWSQHELTVAARCAGLEAVLAKEIEQLQVEGGLDVDAKGLPRMNPRASAIGSINATLAIALRSLGFATPTTDRRQLNAAAQANTATRKVLARASSDKPGLEDLLA